MYFKTCASIDQHNRMRQDDLMLEKKIVTKDWSKRVCLSIFGMFVVDSFLAHKHCQERNPNKIKLGQREYTYYEKLAEELIDNRFEDYNDINGAHQCGDDPVNTSGTGNGLELLAPRLTPCRRKRRNRAGNLTRRTFQGRCYTCKENGKTMVCSECAKNGVERFVCSTRRNKKGEKKTCFTDHLEKGDHCNHYQREN